MYRLSSLIVIVCLFSFFGCSHNQTMKDSWKYSKHQYYSYINTPAQLDMDDSGDSEPYELKLGEKIIVIDTHIAQLKRAMDNADSSPDQEWVMGMVNKFPWLSAVALANPEGGIEAKYPEQTMKEFDISPLTKEDPKQGMLDLRTYAKMTPLGAEVYVAKPVYMNGGLRGYVAASFDPQQLIHFSIDPSDSFLMLCPYGVLWKNGNFPAEALTEDWSSILESSTSGVRGSGNSRYFWTTRYLGNMPIVYIISTAETKAP